MLEAALVLLGMAARRRPQRHWAHAFEAMRRATWTGRAGVMQQLQGRQTVMSREQRRRELEHERVRHQAYLERRERTVLEDLTGHDVERMRQAEAKRRRKAGRK